MNEVCEQIQEDIITMMEGIRTPVTLTESDALDMSDDLCDIVVHRMKDALTRQFRTNNFDVEGTLNDITMQHRTHQACIIRNMLEVVKKYHKQVNGFDQRNAKAIEVSKKVDELRDTFIPYI